MTYNFSNGYINSITKKYPVVGPDVSHWQGLIRWQKIAEWAHFVFIRAGSGGGPTGAYQDRRFRENWIGARNAKIHRSAYWFFVPEFDPTVQANFFVSQLLADKGEIDPIVDLEVNKTGLSAEIIKNRLKKFMNIVDTRTGKRCGIYTSHGFVTTHMGYNLGISMLSRIRWTANWSRMSPVIPPGYSGWDFWQFIGDSNHTGRQLGVSSAALDLNVWNGDLNSFYAKFGSSGKAPVIQIPPKKIAPNVNLRIREGPSTTSRIKGYAYANSTWDVQEIVGDNPREQWVKIADNTYMALWKCRKIF